MWGWRLFYLLGVFLLLCVWFCLDVMMIYALEMLSRCFVWRSGGLRSSAGEVLVVCCDELIVLFWGVDVSFGLIGYCRSTFNWDYHFFG